MNCIGEQEVGKGRLCGQAGYAGRKGGRKGGKAQPHPDCQIVRQAAQHHALTLTARLSDMQPSTKTPTAKMSARIMLTWAWV